MEEEKHSLDCALWPFSFDQRLMLLGRIDHSILQKKLLTYQIWVDSQRRRVDTFLPLPIFASYLKKLVSLPSYFLPIDVSITQLSDDVDSFFLHWKDDEVGFGLFARRDFLSGEFVGLYGGRVRKLSLFHNQDRTYTAELFRPFCSLFPYVVDASAQGSLFRYVNHSRTPNLAVQAIRVASLPFLAFRTIRPICKGEELFLSYGSSYWNSGKKEKILSY